MCLVDANEELKLRVFSNICAKAKKRRSKARRLVRSWMERRVGLQKGLQSLQKELELCKLCKMKQIQLTFSTSPLADTQGILSVVNVSCTTLYQKYRKKLATKKLK